MTVSLLIVVPTLNSYELLPRLVRSLNQQSWPNWRLLFVDGPSGCEHRKWLQQCCVLESRCHWLEQNPSEPGIFGAMNQGFAQASPIDWVLFLGSDDWLAGPHMLRDAINSIEITSTLPDLLVCRGRYVDASSGMLTRHTAFHSSALLNAASFRRLLLHGSTPPHQATFIGPGARRYLNRYLPSFRLSADLDYFLQLSRHSGLLVKCVDLELVYMSDAGVSGQQTFNRLQEVFRAYRRAFAWFWWFPFVVRYCRRILSMFHRP